MDKNQKCVNTRLDPISFAFVLYRFIGAAMIVVASGCAFVPQAVIINPKVDGPTSDVGAGKFLSLNIVDERSRQTLGTRGNSMVGADLTISGDLTSIVHSALADGLSRQNFKLSPSIAGQQNELRVEIRTLDYTVMQDTWSNRLRVDAGLKAICLQGSTRPYEKLHSAEIVRSFMTIARDEENNQYISAAVSESIRSLLSDTRLMKCLAQAVSAP